MGSDTHDGPSEPPVKTSGVIELHLREVRQLFEALDPAPFREKDLDRDAEEYIVGSAEELSSGDPTELLIYLDGPTGFSDNEQIVGDAVRTYFSRRATLVRRDLRRLIRRGLVSLAIGMAFLTVLFTAARLLDMRMGDGALVRLLKESLVIGGWVAMWRPLEIFLYDWWPILGQQRTYERLSQISVRLVPVSPKPQDELARIISRPAAPPSATPPAPNPH